jgi:predicted CXXCH cytochrome family protein
MRKLLVTALALLPGLASATIVGSKHDLFAGAAVNFSGAVGNATSACSYCHSAHHTAATKGLWRRADTTNPNLPWGNGSTTTAGTSLPTTLAGILDSKRCFSCHDGTIALNSVVKYPAGGSSVGPGGNVTIGGGLAGTDQANVTGGALNNTGPSYLNRLEGSHPVSIAYPAASNTGYFGILTTGCGSGISNCTTAGTNISLKPNASVGGTGVSVECQSCHDVHEPATGAGQAGYFLRTVTGGVCVGCHNK